ncbi:hypothetical protein GCM10022406_29850 [Hymenobacter algoricola]|uniref:Outer membrane protein beta-barrel domain-containing protein n=1 Tax=Hymenobacter algoricola TaxID=486267 RepID=A0ABP7NI68_9BACT
MVTAAAQTPAAAVSPLPANPYPSSSLGLSVGWGAPYGLGIDFSRMVGRQADIGLGVGLGLGGKVGVGARYYFRPAAVVQPYVGLNLVLSQESFLNKKADWTLLLDGKTNHTICPVVD